MELFTGILVSTPLDTCLLPDRGEPLQEVDLSNVDDFLNRLRESFKPCTLVMGT